MFTSEDEAKIQIAVARMTPSARLAHLPGVKHQLAKLSQRYGDDITREALNRLMLQFPALAEKVIEILPEPVQEELQAKSIDMIAALMESAGLRTEDHIRVSDQGFAVTKEALAVLSSTGFPSIQALGEGNESLVGCGLDRTNGFTHPLTEETKAESVEGCWLNIWGLVSTTISIAMGWAEGDQAICLKLIEDAIPRVAPTLDLKLLMRRARYDDRALLRLCSVVHEGLESLNRRV